MPRGSCIALAGPVPDAVRLMQICSDGLTHRRVYQI